MTRAAIALVTAVAFACGAPARATPRGDFDQQQLAELIMRILAHAAYQQDASRAGGHIDVDGAEGVVIALEPLDKDARRLLGAPNPFARPDVLWWDESRLHLLARARPHGRVALHNPVPEAASFELYRGNRLWRRVTVEAHADAVLLDLPEGVVRVRRVGGDVDGWIYVTPWPSRVLRAERRETFDVPPGRYRLHGWHPRGGERTVIVNATTNERGDGE